MKNTVKFYISFIAEYARQSIRDSLVNFLGLNTEYLDDKLLINYYHKGEKFMIVLPREKKMCPFKKVETHSICQNDNACESVNELASERVNDRECESSVDDEICMINEEIKVTDVTKHIKKVIGPHYDFHKIPTTPGMLGYDNLVFYRKNGDKVKYSKISIITV